MNVWFTKEAVAALRHATKDQRDTVQNLLGSYACYLNRHALPGKSTLKNIGKKARMCLGLPPGTRVFERETEAVACIERTTTTLTE